MSPHYPNILYIHSHDTGRYIQPYGHAIATPRLQRLAEEGVLFRQAFCAAPTCSASRASLLTGQYPHSNGMLGLAHRGFSLHDYQQHIVNTLSKLHYYSVLIGEQHIAKEPAIIGYDRVIKIESTRAEILAPIACDFLEHVPQEPFFLSVGFFETHREFPTESTPEANYCAPPSFLPDMPEVRQDMAAFEASAISLDHGIAMVLDALEQNGLAENTLVICTTDHGIAFPGAKGSLRDAGIGVMLIMRGPGGFSGGKVCDAMISQTDLFPTICDLLGIEPPAWLQGKSFLPVVQEQTDKIHEHIYAESTYHAAYEPQRAVRTSRWKYIRRFDGRTRPVLPNTDDSLSKDAMLKAGWATHLLEEEQLYDLWFDPTETHNLIYDPAYATIREQLSRQMKEWMRDTDDPLYSGPVAAPPGAVLNDPDQISPVEPVTIVQAQD